MIKDVLPSASVLMTEFCLLLTDDKAAFASANFFAISLLSTEVCAEDVAVVVAVAVAVVVAVAVLVKNDDDAVFATVH